MKLKQIYASSVYSISERYRGWSARFHYLNQYFEELYGSAELRLDYAQPLGLKGQIQLW
jgi:hypothetical protein